MVPNVDLVLVIDESDSICPCIDQLHQHLHELVKPMQGYVSRVRFGLVTVSASDFNGSLAYNLRTLVGDWKSVEGLYRAGCEQSGYFTEDADAFIKALDDIEVSADEHNLFALDIALDNPFGPAANTKRVVAPFSDETLEASAHRAAGVEKLPQLIAKIHQRRVKLFCAMPYSDAAQQLSEANGSKLEIVDSDQGGGLAGIDFRALLSQMGKSISVSTLQGPLHEDAPVPLFGQNQWSAASTGWNAQDDR